MEQLSAKGQTTDARIAHWRSLGWHRLRAMMEPSANEERPDADILEAQPIPVRVQVPFTAGQAANPPADLM